jgi:hypothetical protein
MDRNIPAGVYVYDNKINVAYYRIWGFHDGDSALGFDAVVS